MASLGSLARAVNFVVSLQGVVPGITIRDYFVFHAPPSEHEHEQEHEREQKHGDITVPSMYIHGFDTQSGKGPLNVNNSNFYLRGYLHLAHILMHEEKAEPIHKTWRTILAKCVVHPLASSRALYAAVTGGHPRAIAKIRAALAYGARLLQPDVVFSRAPEATLLRLSLTEGIWNAFRHAAVRPNLDSRSDIPVPLRFVRLVDATVRSKIDQAMSVKAASNATCHSTFGALEACLACLNEIDVEYVSARAKQMSSSRRQCTADALLWYFQPYHGALYRFLRAAAATADDATHSADVHVRLPELFQLLRSNQSNTDMVSTVGDMSITDVEVLAMLHSHRVTNFMTRDTRGHKSLLPMLRALDDKLALVASGDYYPRDADATSMHERDWRQLARYLQRCTSTIIRDKPTQAAYTSPKKHKSDSHGDNDGGDGDDDEKTSETDVVKVTLPRREAAVSFDARIAQLHDTEWRHVCSYDDIPAVVVAIQAVMNGRDVPAQCAQFLPYVLLDQNIGEYLMAVFFASYGAACRTETYDTMNARIAQLRDVIVQNDSSGVFWHIMRTPGIVWSSGYLLLLTPSDVIATFVNRHRETNPTLYLTLLNSIHRHATEQSTNLQGAIRAFALRVQLALGQPNAPGIFAEVIREFTPSVDVTNVLRHKHIGQHIGRKEVLLVLDQYLAMQENIGALLHNQAFVHLRTYTLNSVPFFYVEHVATNPERIARFFLAFESAETLIGEFTLRHYRNTDPILRPLLCCLIDHVEQEKQQQQQAAYANHKTPIRIDWLRCLYIPGYVPHIPAVVFAMQVLFSSVVGVKLYSRILGKYYRVHRLAIQSNLRYLPIEAYTELAMTFTRRASNENCYRWLHPRYIERLHEIALVFDVEMPCIGANVVRAPVTVSQIA